MISSSVILSHHRTYRSVYGGSSKLMSHRKLSGQTLSGLSSSPLLDTDGLLSAPALPRSSTPTSCGQPSLLLKLSAFIAILSSF